MKAAFTIPVLLTLAVLNGCMLMHESDPSVIRSSVRIEMAKRGDLQLATGWLRDVIYIQNPRCVRVVQIQNGLCSCSMPTGGARRRSKRILGRVPVTSSKCNVASRQATGLSLAIWLLITNTETYTCASPKWTCCSGVQLLNGVSSSIGTVARTLRHASDGVSGRKALGPS